MAKERGFSLIELLIVVAILLILAAISIPNMLKSRQVANQASAVGSMRTINTAEVTYASTYNTGYSTTLAQLGGSGPVATTASAELIDTVLASGVKSSYQFYYVACPAAPGPNTGAMANGACAYVATYQASANPLGGSVNGVSYFSDASGVIRSNTTAAAGPADSPIGN
ncbi:MAG TPA: type II secretion system protein [Terriglobia bacterium]|nr:type II secretion system protein [Terriglobia bacterium]